MKIILGAGCSIFRIETLIVGSWWESCDVIELVLSIYGENTIIFSSWGSQRESPPALLSLRSCLTAYQSVSCYAYLLPMFHFFLGIPEQPYNHDPFFVYSKSTMVSCSSHLDPHMRRFLLHKSRSQCLLVTWQSEVLNNGYYISQVVNREWIQYGFLPQSTRSFHPSRKQDQLFLWATWQYSSAISTGCTCQAGLTPFFSFNFVSNINHQVPHPMFNVCRISVAWCAAWCVALKRRERWRWWVWVPFSWCFRYVRSSFCYFVLLACEARKQASWWWRCFEIALDLPLNLAVSSPNGHLNVCKHQFSLPECVFTPGHLFLGPISWPDFENDSAKLCTLSASGGASGEAPSPASCGHRACDFASIYARLALCLIDDIFTISYRVLLAIKELELQPYPYQY